MVNSSDTHATEIEFTADGYLRLSKESAAQFFPNDVLVPLWRDGMLLLLPTRGPAAGGLMLKQRNTQGDRSLLVSEVLQFEIVAGKFQAVWDDQVGGLRIALPRRDESNLASPATDRAKQSQMGPK